MYNDTLCMCRLLFKRASVSCCREREVGREVGREEERLGRVGRVGRVVRLRG